MRDGVPIARVAPEKRPHVLLDGPYGKANLGDNAIAYCMSRFLVRNGVDVTISCIDPDYISGSFGLAAVPALNFRQANLGVLRKVADFDAVIIGGGQQLMEYRIPNPFIGMFARVCHMARAAEKHDIPFIAWSVGMDWPLSAIAKFQARRYMGGKNSTLILRDGVSFGHAEQLFEGRSCRLMRNKDAAFMIADMLDAEGGMIAGRRHEPRAEKRLLVCPSLLDGAQGALDKLVDLCVEAAQHGYEVLGWHSEIRPDYDVRVRSMAAWDSIPGFQWLPPAPIDTKEVADLIRSASLVITTRMHPAILAVSQGVASYGLATNGKMRSIFGELSLPYSDVTDMSALTFADVIRCNFGPSIVQAAAFGREAQRGGEQVLDAIRHKRDRAEQL